MSESEVVSTNDDLDALRALQADAPALERIEALLDRFNALEAGHRIGERYVMRGGFQVSTVLLSLEYMT